MKWKKREISALIEYIRPETSLWDPNDANYNNIIHKKNLYKEIATKIGKDAEDVRLKVKGLKQQFNVHLEKEKTIKTDAMAAGKRLRKWQFRDALQFLECTSNTKGSRDIVFEKIDIKGYDDDGEQEFDEEEIEIVEETDMEYEVAYDDSVSISNDTQSNQISESTAKNTVDTLHESKRFDRLRNEIMKLREMLAAKEEECLKQQKEITVLKVENDFMREQRPDDTIRVFADYVANTLRILGSPVAKKKMIDIQIVLNDTEQN